MDDLNNCAFCGSRPYSPSRIKRKKQVTACSNSRCEIFGVHVDIDKWNSAGCFSWVDINQCMPDERQKVLIRCTDGDVIVGYYFMDDHFNDGVSRPYWVSHPSNYQYDDSQVLEWMQIA